MKRTKKEIMKGIDSEKSRIVANNTIEYFKNGNRNIRLHDTDIISFFEDGSYILNSGGWRTHTTKERINRFVPGLRLHQEKGIWYVNGEVFYDGIHFTDDHVLKSNPIPDPIKANAKIKRKIAKFVKQIDDIKEIPIPNAGDCWICSMFGPDKTCLESHLDENYLHGSLIVNALRDKGYKDDQLPFVITSKWAVKNALRRYLTRNLIKDIAV